MSKDRLFTYNTDTNNTKIPFKITRRRNQKHIHIKIDHEGKVEVTGPLSINELQVREILKKKSDWIKKNRQKQLNSQLPDILDIIFFKGETHKVKLIKDTKNTIKLNSKCIEIYHKKPNREKDTQKLYRWLKKQALEELEIILDQLKQTTGLKYKKISIRNQKSRWGSSSSSGTLSFNFRIIMAPLYVRKYIALHELCHQKHHNHSKRFWNEVAKWQPDYKKAEKWLKDYSAVMNLFR